MPRRTYNPTSVLTRAAQVAALHAKYLDAVRSAPEQAAAVVELYAAKIDAALRGEAQGE